jgi:hypothetical protein
VCQNETVALKIGCFFCNPATAATKESNINYALIVAMLLGILEEQNLLTCLFYQPKVTVPDSKKI